LVKVSGLLLLPVYLHLMDQEEFGLHGYFIAIVNYSATLLNGGFYLIQSKLYFESPIEKRGQVLFSIHLLLVALMLVVLVPVLGFNFDVVLINKTFTHSINYPLFRPAIIIGVFTTSYGLMVTQFYLVSGFIKKLQAFNILRSLVPHAIAILLLFRLTNSNGAFLRIAGTYYTECCLLMIFAGVVFNHFDYKFNYKVARTTIKLVFPIALYTAFSMVIFMSDRFFIETYGTLKDLAIYNLAWTVAGIIPFISNSAHNIWLPQLLAETDSKRKWSTAKSMSIKLIIGFTIISIATLIMVKALLYFSIINQKYEKVIPVLPLVLFGSALLSFFQLTFNYLLSITKSHILVAIGFCVALVSIYLGKSLVLRWGVYGAALSMVISNLLLLLPSLFFSYYSHKKAI
ncbi:MAG: lipopolysaccharide biosynthesis protein, partial [Flammeovirgaceae bacterium]